MHTVDENTYILYRLNAAASGALTSSVADSTGNGYDLTFSSTNFHSNGPGDTGFVRVFNGGVGASTTVDVNSTLITASRGEVTVEAWVWLKSGHGDIELFNGPRGVGETAPTDFTGRYRILTSGFLDSFWENTGVDAGTAAQSTGLAVPDEQWTHVAWVRRDDGSNVIAEYYVSGALQDFATASIGLPSSQAGTDDPTLSIGNMDGMIRSLRFSDTVRSGSEISSSAGLSSFTHPIDANTIVLWNMDDGAPDFEDLGKRGLHQVLTAGTSERGSSLVDEFSSGSVIFRAATAQTHDLFRPEFRSILTGSYTIETWIRQPDDGGDVIFCRFGDTGETQATNVLVQLTLQSAGNLRFFGEQGAGVNESYTTTAAISDPKRPHHIGFIKRSHPDGKMTFDFYVDGQFLETSSGSADLNNVDGGTTATWGVPNSEAVDKPVIADFRLSDIERTPSEILQSYQNATTSSTAAAIVPVFRALSGSQYIYFTADEPEPDGITIKTRVK